MEPNDLRAYAIAMWLRRRRRKRSGAANLVVPPGHPGPGPWLPPGGPGGGGGGGGGGGPGPGPSRTGTPTLPGTPPPSSASPAFLGRRPPGRARAGSAPARFGRAGPRGPLPLLAPFPSPLKLSSGPSSRSSSGGSSGGSTPLTTLSDWPSPPFNVGKLQWSRSQLPNVPTHTPTPRSARIHTPRPHSAPASPKSPRIAEWNGAILREIAQHLTIPHYADMRDTILDDLFNLENIMQFTSTPGDPDHKRAIELYQQVQKNVGSYGSYVLSERAETPVHMVAMPRPQFIDKVDPDGNNGVIWDRQIEYAQRNKPNLFSHLGYIQARSLVNQMDAIIQDSVVPERHDAAVDLANELDDIVLERLSQFNDTALQELATAQREANGVVLDDVQQELSRRQQEQKGGKSSSKARVYRKRARRSRTGQRKHKKTKLRKIRRV